MERHVTAELLDADAGTAREVQDSLHDLEHINQWFGGIRSEVKLLRKVAEVSGARRLSLVEVASGTGYVPRRAQQVLARQGIQLDVSLLDRAASHLPASNVSAYVGDALALPFPDRNFDVVSCGLFLHHLSPEQVKEYAREALRVARVAVVISDIVRSQLHLALTTLGLPLFRSPITRHDAPASVRAAYTISEARALLADCGARRVDIEPHYLCRMGITLWK